ncbi:protein YgfX [Shewanella litoralis]|nr:protein YgfX [Shewanella litoralis]
MDEQRLNASATSTRSFSTHQHQFALSASFLYRFALVCFFAVILCSFLAWPASSSSLYLLIQLLLVMLTLGLLVYCWRKSSLWHCVFNVDKTGIAALSDAESEVCLVEFSRHPIVTPIVCVIFLRETQTGENRWVWVWQDMLSDTEYRTLCRILLQRKLS